MSHGLKREELFTLEHHSCLIVVVERRRARVVDLFEEEE